MDTPWTLETIRCPPRAHIVFAFSCIQLESSPMLRDHPTKETEPLQWKEAGVLLRKGSPEPLQRDCWFRAEAELLGCTM